MSDEMSTADSAEVVESVESTADLETAGAEETLETYSEAVTDTEDTGAETIEEDEPQSTGKRKLEYKGRSREVDDDELVTLAQQGWAAGEQLREAAQLRKQLEQQAQWIEDLKGADVNTARKMLRDAGLDVRQLSEAEIIDLIAEEQLTPEQRKIREYEQRLAEFESRQQQEEHQRQQQEMSAAAERAHKEYAEQFEAALSEAGLSPTPHRIGRMAWYAHAALENGVDADPADLARMVADEHRGDLGAHLDGLDVDGLIELIGPERMKAIRKRDLEKVGGRPTSSGVRSKPNGTQRQAPMTTDDFRARLDRYRD